MQHVMISQWYHYPTINDSWSTAKIFCMRFKLEMVCQLPSLQRTTQSSMH